MGMSLNKKYFGNRNIGTGGQQLTVDENGNVITPADDKIGGEGVASVTMTVEGTYTSSLPTVAFSLPDLPGGVQATGIVHGHALTAVATAAGTGYDLGQVLTQNTGGTGRYATWNVTGVKVVNVTINNGGSANDPGDEFTFSIAGFETPLRVRVETSNAGVATSVSIVNGGVWTNGALPGNTVGMTRVQVADGQDHNGTGLVLNLTAWGVATVAVIEQGDYTAINSGPKNTTVSPTGGTGATLTITYGVSGVSIDEKGSGYTTTVDAAPTFSSGVADGNSVLTVDTGDIGSSTYQENAIIVYANTDGNGRKIGDIIRQVSTHQFKVKTTGGIATCLLKSSELSTTPTEDVNRMTIVATDSAGGTYYVTKITAHKCVVTQGTGAQFASNSSVQWTFGSAVLNTSVKIANA
jgi:hypothetical protein